MDFVFFFRSLLAVLLLCQLSNDAEIEVSFSASVSKYKLRKVVSPKAKLLRPHFQQSY